MLSGKYRTGFYDKLCCLRDVRSLRSADVFLCVAGVLLTVESLKAVESL